MTFSHKTISLYDSRYSSIPVSQFPVNINYEGLELKKLFNSSEEQICYAAVDTSRKDNSFLIFDILEQECAQDEFFNEFIDSKLINTNKSVYDCCGVLFENNLVSFFTDSFGGLYCGVYNMINTTNFTNGKNVTKIEGDFLKPTMNHPHQTEEDLLCQLYEKINLNSFYKKKKNQNEKIKYENSNNNEEHENLSSEGDLELEEFIKKEITEEDESEEVDTIAGTAVVNGLKKKMYKYINTRKLLNVLINNSESIPEIKTKQEDMVIDDEVDDDNNGRNMDWLFDQLEDAYLS